MTVTRPTAAAPPSIVVHPFALALYPPLLLYSRNTGSIYLGEIPASCVATLLATLAGWAGLRRLGIGPARAGLIVSALLFVAFGFGRNVHVAKTWGVGPTPDAREWIVLLGSLAAFAGWVALLRRRPGLVPPCNAAANAGSLVLLATLAPLGATRDVRPAPRSAAIAPGPAAPIAHSTRRDPDIYWIVLDAFGRRDVLEATIGWDDGPFLDRMRRRGFAVADRSTANYCQTALSLTATLDGEYHDGLAGSTSSSRLPLRDRMADNAAARFLRARGYRTVGFATGFGLTDGFPADDRLAPAGNLREFDALLLDTTPAWTLLGLGSGRASHRAHRARILHLFDQLPGVAADPRPTFCLAHVVAPHPPFVFGRDGEDVSAREAGYALADGRPWCEMSGHDGPGDYAARYRAQAEYVAARVEAAVDSILARSPEPPVIIIQGDHGPGSHFDPDDARPNDLAERFGILNLALVPGGGDAGPFYPTITPVNTFRILFDHLFGTGRGRLPDRNYYSSYQAPYRFIEVTSEVADAPEASRPGDAAPAR